MHEKINFIKKSDLNRNRRDCLTLAEKEKEKQEVKNFLKELLTQASDDIKDRKIFLGKKPLTIGKLKDEIEGDTEEGDLIVDAILGLKKEFHLDKKFKEDFIQ